MTSRSSSAAGNNNTAACHVPTGRPTSLSGISAAEFDRELDHEESRTGVTKLRKRLAGRAVGHVLEVAVGTGRNFDLYDWDTVAGVSSSEGSETAAKQAPAKKNRGSNKAEEAPKMLSFTGLDIASDMLDVAGTKLKSVDALSKALENPTVTVLRDANNDVAAGALEYLSGALRLVKADALSFLPPPPQSSSAAAAAAAESAPLTKYDTIIQTFGLCSVSSPHSILSRLASAVKPETGRILLLEHGRGTWGLVNWWLDRYAPDHFCKYGCWWNRDIERIVRDATRAVRVEDGGARLEVVKVERPGFQGGYGAMDRAEGCEGVGK